MPTKAFACICVHIFCTIYENGVLANPIPTEELLAHYQHTKFALLYRINYRSHISEIFSDICHRGGSRWGSVGLFEPPFWQELFRLHGDFGENVEISCCFPP